MVQPDFGPIIYSYRPRRARREIGLTLAKHARTRFKEVRKEEEPAGRIGERERDCTSRRPNQHRTGQDKIDLWSVAVGVCVCVCVLRPETSSLFMFWASPERAHGCGCVVWHLNRLRWKEKCQRGALKSEKKVSEACVKSRISFLFSLLFTASSFPFSWLWFISRPKTSHRRR